MRLGKNQKAAALAAASDAISDPRLKRVGDGWAVIGYRKHADQSGDPGHIWRAHLLVKVSQSADAAPRQGCQVKKHGEWWIYFERFGERTRRDLVALLETLRVEP